MNACVAGDARRFCGAYWRNAAVLLAMTALLLGPDVALADDFVPDDVEICPPATEIRDPEIDVRGKRVAFTDAQMRLKVARIRADATLGPRGCLGETIDTDLTISLPGITYKNGPEWGSSQFGSVLFYTKLGSDGQPLLARARLDGGGWTMEALAGGERRLFPVATRNQAHDHPTIFYWRLNDDGSFTTVWREEANSPETEQEFPGFANSQSGGAPRWIPGLRAITTQVPDIDGVTQAARYFIDESRTEILTSDAGNKDEVWMWQAPEFGGDWVFSTVVDGGDVRIYRQFGASWALIHSFAATDLSQFGRIFSPEPFTYRGRSYLAMQFALFQRYGPSQIWIASIDPSAPLYRQVSAPGDALQIRNEPEWYADRNGAYVFYTHVTATGFALRRARTGL